ncbi:MAG: YihY/virulence factor BrkB family protein [Deltaproteobacteria bacterium]|nr:YihY/virulence factor BrkB family protein [Deltaproteobacteria bacterium]
MKKFFIIISDSIRAFSYDNCLSMAAAISFYALFSLLPLMFLLFSLIGSLLGAETWLFERILQFVKDSLPYLSDSIVEDIKGLVDNRRVFGWFGIIMLMWSAEFVIQPGWLYGERF